MGDLESLHEFRRQKERAGRIRFLERDEEARLFAAIKSRSEDAYRLSVFLVDSGCRLGEALGLTWNDIKEHRVSFQTIISSRNCTIPMTEQVKEVIRLPPDGRRRSKGPFTKLSQAQFAAIWNEAKAGVGLGAEWQKRDEVIALKSGSSRFVFPLKQFVDARPADGTAELIAMFGDHRLAWKWLMTPTDKLGGNSPIDTLLAGTLADVVAAARLAVEHAPDV